nr:MAG TPA: helix-turn-helix domain-containing protein [Caudoviricetes sp.]
MKSVIISIRPKWVGKIARGEKTIEVRKSAPQQVPFKAYIYATRPKIFYKCGAVSTSAELLWLTNGKVEMGDGFKFWANGDEYQCLNGRIIGEFICDKIDDFYCASVPYQRENNLGYGQGIVFECNDRYIDTNDLKEMCLSAQELFDYIGGVGKHLYAWHISDLKIYDNPKELSEFYLRKFDNNDYCSGCIHHETPITEYPCNDCRRDAFERKYLTRPPQSWQYVEDLGDEK